MLTNPILFVYGNSSFSIWSDIGGKKYTDWGTLYISIHYFKEKKGYRFGFDRYLKTELTTGAYPVSASLFFSRKTYRKTKNILNEIN